MATPMPTDTPLAEPEPSPDPPLLEPSAGGCTALPSPPASASVFAALLMANAPPALIVIAPIEARAMDFAMLMPTAAATDTPPSEVDAFGVADALPSPEPPFDCERPFAKPRCWFACAVTPLVVPSLGLLEPSAGAPAADAVASAALPDDSPASIH